MARTQTERLWIGGGVVVAILLAAAGWAFVVSPKMSQANSLRSQTSDTELQNLSLQDRVSKLREDFTKINQLRAQRDQMRQALPTDNNLALFTKQVSDEARAAHVTVTAVTAGAAAPVVEATPTAPAATTSTDSSSASSSASSSSTVTTTSAGAASGLYAIPITLTVTGSAANDVRFLDAVQNHGQRAALLSATQLQAGSTASTGGGSANAGAVTMNASLQIFVEPPTLPATPTAATPTVAAGS